MEDLKITPEKIDVAPRLRELEIGKSAVFHTSRRSTIESAISRIQIEIGYVFSRKTDRKSKTITVTRNE